MKILQLSQDYLPAIGGIAAHVYNLSKAEKELGYEVFVATQQSLYPKRNISKWQITEVEQYGLNQIIYPIIYSPRNLLLNFQLKYRFGKYLNDFVKREKIDLIHWHTYSEDLPVLQGIKHTIPFVFTNHSSLFLLDVQKGIAKSEILNNFSIADFIFAPSEELVDETINVGYPGKSVMEINNGIDVELFKPVNKETKNLLRKQFLPNCSFKDKLLICGRRFVFKNGIHILLDSIKELLKSKTPISSLQFVFMGSPSKDTNDSYEKEMLEKIDELIKEGAKIELLGSIPLLNVHNYYKLADFSLLPSIIEAKSITALESMAVGCTVISTNTGGLDQIVSDKITGFKTETNNIAKYAELIMTATNTSLEDIDKININAREFVLKDYVWKNIAQIHIDKYKDVINLFSKERSI